MSRSQLEDQKPRAADNALEINADASAIISHELRRLLADVFALYMKTKNFHWHMSGPHFRDYHLLLDEHADQLFAMTDQIAERARKLNGTTLRSIGDIARNQRLKDSDEQHVPAEAMLKEFLADNRGLITYLRSARQLCDRTMSRRPV